jgi:ACS family hexuronate transporter-like MFS transporter
MITLLFALSTFSYATFTTIANVFPSDLFYSQSVASVSGMSGTAAGIGTIIAFELIGHYSDSPHVASTHSFDGVVTVAGILPFIGMILVLLLIRNTKATKQGLVRPI